MQRWEHLIIPSRFSDGKIRLGDNKVVTEKEYLNMLGDEGWELVTVMPVEPFERGCRDFFMKRPKS
jgi:hypothetical protein